MGIKDSSTETESSAENSNKVEKYKKFFTEDLYEEIVSKGVLFTYIENIDKYKVDLENIDIKFLEEGNLGKNIG